MAPQDGGGGAALQQGLQSQVFPSELKPDGHDPFWLQ